VSIRDSNLCALVKEKLKNKRIAVLMGGWSAEREISLLTGKAVLKALQKEGFKVIGIDLDKNIVENLKKYKIDFVFLALHGPLGEDGKMQGLLEILGIPYTGSGPLASALAMNKIYAKRIFAQAGIPTPPWVVVNQLPVTSYQLQGLKLPVVVKPAAQGSAIGVSVVIKGEELSSAIKKARKLDKEVLVEKYIPGREVTVGILGEETLPIIEIVPKSKFYDYRSKYAPGGSEHIIPARLEKKVAKETARVALQAHRALGCRAYSRVDLRVDRRGQPWVLEINTIPGMTTTSLLPDAARAVGISFNELVLKIIQYSLKASEFQKF